MGIIGHELSHLDRRHQLKPLQQQQLAKQQLAGSAKQGFDLNRMFDFGKISLGSYHPIHLQEEAEADNDAVRWMYESPLSLMVRLTRRLVSLSRSSSIVSV